MDPESRTDPRARGVHRPCFEANPTETLPLNARSELQCQTAVAGDDDAVRLPTDASGLHEEAEKFRRRLSARLAVAALQPIAVPQKEKVDAQLEVQKAMAPGLDAEEPFSDPPAAIAPLWETATETSVSPNNCEPQWQSAMPSRDRFRFNSTPLVRAGSVLLLLFAACLMPSMHVPEVDAALRLETDSAASEASGRDDEVAITVEPAGVAETTAVAIDEMPTLIRPPTLVETTQRRPGQGGASVDHAVPAVPAVISLVAVEVSNDSEATLRTSAAVVAISRERRDEGDPETIVIDERQPAQPFRPQSPASSGTATAMPAVTSELKSNPLGTPARVQSAASKRVAHRHKSGRAVRLSARRANLVLTATCNPEGGACSTPGRLERRSTGKRGGQGRSAAFDDGGALTANEIILSLIRNDIDGQLDRPRPKRRR